MLRREPQGSLVQSQGAKKGMGSVRHVCGVSLVQPGSWQGPEAWESLAKPRRGEDFPSRTQQPRPSGGRRQGQEEEERGLLFF